MTETPEQAQTRRRWITLAEAVAVAGVLIAALTLYLSWSDKRDERAEQAASRQAQTRTASVITLRGTRAKGGERLELADPAHPVDTITVTFPTALGVGVKEAALKPAIEADWPAAPLRDLTDGKATGRVPVLIASTFWDGETKRIDRAIYDVIWSIEDGLLGRDFKLDGLMLRERGGSQARLDAIWKQVAPKPKPD